MSKILSFYNTRLKKTSAAQSPNTTKDYAVYASPQDMVQENRPALPVYVLNPAHIKNTGAQFVRAFPGTTMFAVKTNPHPVAIKALHQGGVKAFDVASIEEMRIVRSVAPKATLYFMHPVKSPEAIHEAYFTHGVRHFVLDHADELAKILRETGDANDLHLFVRAALPKNDNASIDLSAKFGATPDEAVALLRQCRKHAMKLGLAFHVGTQISDAAAYANAVNVVRGLIQRSHVKVDVLDVGGGFPVAYEGEDVPSISTCIDVIRTAIAHAGLEHMELLAEPGRALVAQGGSLVVRVELRKGNRLYINDGTYGGLFDAGKWLNTRFPVRAIRMDGDLSSETQAFTLAGPTCDSLDMMNGPFMLPDDIRMGDWIEILNTGAYSQSIRTNFNGFGACDTVLIG